MHLSSLLAHSSLSYVSLLCRIDVYSLSHVPTHVTCTHAAELALGSCSLLSGGLGYVAPGAGRLSHSVREMI